MIGDGALTGGMAWEALNNLGSAPERPVIVVLNDNARSYAPTAGAMAAHLAQLRAAGPARPAGNVFAALGLAYLGPVDGHDIPALEEALRHARSLEGPVVVHAITTKGKGYGPAESDRTDHLHAVGVLDPTTGTPVAAGALTWTEAFGRALAEAAGQRPDVVALTAAMLQPTGLDQMAQRFPERVFDVGIAEQHAVTCAAGLATAGLHPVVAVYATFLNRAFDQVLMDVGLHRLAVTFVLDRAGVTGPDGPSHHGLWDLAVLRSVPGLRIAAPRDTVRLRALLREALDEVGGPTVLRLPKQATGAAIDAVARMDGIDILHRSARLPLDVLLVPVGPLAAAALESADRLAAGGIGVTVVDPEWCWPVNPALPALAARNRLVVSIEDAISSGGVGAALAEACRIAGVATPISALGLPHAYLTHGTRTELLHEAGLDAAGIEHSVRAALGLDAAAARSHAGWPA